MNKSKVLLGIIFGAALVAVGTCTAWLMPRPLPVQPNFWQQFLQTAGVLFLVALFIERFIEAVLAPFRRPEANLLEHKADEAGEKQKELEAVQIKLSNDFLIASTVAPAAGGHSPAQEIEQKLATVRSQVDVAKQAHLAAIDARNKHCATTFATASLIGFVVGLFVAGAGVRAVSLLFTVPASAPLVKTEPAANPTKPVEAPGSSVAGPLRKQQHLWFLWSDVLLTAGVLAGGSEGVHRIFTLYGKFMEARSDKTGKT